MDNEKTDQKKKSDGFFKRAYQMTDDRRPSMTDKQRSVKKQDDDGVKMVEHSEPLVDAQPAVKAADVPVIKAVDEPKAVVVEKVVLPAKKEEQKPGFVDSPGKERKRDSIRSQRTHGARKYLR